MRKTLLRFAALFIVVPLLFSLVHTHANAETFVFIDHNESSLYAREAIARLYSQDIISGGANGRYNPKGYVTRAQAVTMIIRSMGISLEKPDVQTFKDVAKNHWSYPYIETAYHYGITAGTASTAFSPDLNCTREQLVTMLIRANRISTGGLDNSRIQSILNAIKDEKEISQWAKAPMAFAYDQGIISGYSAMLAPRGLATREQMAVILDNYLNRYVTSVNAAPLSIIDLTTSSIEQVRKSVVTIMTYDRDGIPMAQGSGFCVGNGIYLTNYHVIEYGSSYEIISDDGIVFEASGIVKYDQEKDLAIIKAKQPSTIKPLNIGSMQTLTQGVPVVAIGSPLGLMNTVSNGIISAVRDFGDIKLLQITAPITHGSSGGPLFDLDGNVVGITTSGMDEGNLNFAVPIDYAAGWIQALKGLSFSSISVVDFDSVFSSDRAASEAEIKATMDKMFEALRKEDIEAYKSVLAPENPAYSLVHLMLSPIFDFFELNYWVQQPEIYALTSDSAQVYLTYSVIKWDDSDFKEKEMEGWYQLRKYGDTWKIVSQDETLIRYLNPGPIPPDPENDSGPVKIEAPQQSRFLLNFEVTDSVMDPSRPYIYITEKLTKKLYAVNYETQKITELSFSLRPESLTFANGKIYVSLLKGDHHGGWWTEDQKGAVAIVDAAAFKLIKTMDVNIDPYSIAADNNGHIYVSSGSGQHTYVRSYSEATGLEISSRSLYYQSPISINNTGDIFYSVNTNITPRDMHMFYLDENGVIVAAKDSPYHGDYKLNTNFRISPDGKYVFNGSGTVLYASLNYAATIDKPFYDIAFNISNNVFYTGVEGNYIHVYDYSTFKHTKSYVVPGNIKKLYSKPDTLAAIIQIDGRYYLGKIKPQ